MAKSYTLEDVETLRNKAGIRYEEAVELLDKYDGDTTRALIELEKRGRLSLPPQDRSSTLDDIWEYIKQLWNKGWATRIRVERQGDVMVNLSVTALLIFVVLGPYAMIAALVLVLLSGCNLRVQGAEKINKAKAEKESMVEPKAASAEASKNDADSSDDDFPSVTIS